MGDFRSVNLSTFEVYSHREAFLHHLGLTNYKMIAGGVARPAASCILPLACGLIPVVKTGGPA